MTRKKTAVLKFNHFRDNTFYFDGQWITNGDYLIKSQFCKLAPEVLNKGLDLEAPHMVEKCFTKKAKITYDPKPLDYLIHPLPNYNIEKVEDYEVSELLSFKRLYFTEGKEAENRTFLSMGYFNMLNKVFPIFSNGIEWRTNGVLSPTQIYKNEEFVALIMPVQIK